MGSGAKSHKKHKKKDEEEDPELRKIRKEKKKHKHKKEKKAKKEKRRSRGGESSPAVDVIEGLSSRDRKHRQAAEPAPEPPEAAESSLSIAETNKLRARLGLKPLQIDEPVKSSSEKHESGGKTVTVDGETFVHKRPDSWTEAKKREKIKEKLEAAKGKRKFADKLRQTKGLGANEEVDSAAAWVLKSRKLEEEKKRADAREALLAEMDEEFGVGEIVAEEMVKKSASSYSAKQLAGLKIEHSKEAFAEGRDTILVLKDQGVLEEGDEEVLVNPTMETHEGWKKNAELRKLKPGYNPYDDEASDEENPLGLPKEKLLSKYNEEIEGDKKSSFKLDAGGGADLTEEMRQKRMKAQLKAAAQSLELPEMTIAKEYYTKEEMAKFKKPKKLRKLKKLRTLRADDLLDDAPAAAEGPSGSGLTVNISTDFGSRGSRRVVENGQPKPESPSPVPEQVPSKKVDVEALLESINKSFTHSDEEEIYDTPLDDEDAQADLEAALARARRMKAFSNPAPDLPPAQVQDMDVDEREEDDGKKVVLDSMSEYCRGVGDIPTFGASGNRAETEVAERAESSESPSESEESDLEEEAEGPSTAGGLWKPAHFGANDTPMDSEDDDREDDGTLNILEEPDGSFGVAGALKLAAQKHLIEPQDGDSKGVVMTAKMKEFQAKRYSIMDKQFDDIDTKYQRKLERLGGSGPVQDFKEKGNYKPTIMIEYPDESGRKMNPKEAFQYLSWKFHGKKPGKGKIEKYMKRQVQKDILANMKSTDTPLGTVEKLQKKQEETQSPFIVLSGSGKDTAFSQIKKD